MVLDFCLYININYTYIVYIVLTFWKSRSCGCLIPGRVQGQTGRGFGQPGLVEGDPDHGRGVGTG